MTDNQNQINLLLHKLETLMERQDSFSREINNLRIEINSLKAAGEKEDIPLQEEELEYNAPGTYNEPEYEAAPQTIKTEQPIPTPPIENRRPASKTNLEKFIGENLINKIGIAITIIGVAIGAKYSIEHDLISPLTRIILGYLAGTGLLGFGIKLKKKYNSYSAVLVSGAIAIMYFITYSAYSFYGLIPQPLAFILMVVFTAFTVVAAINYNNQVIAHIGLVGAYAIPFLLSEETGQMSVLFSYMAIINVGIVVTSFKKHWKPLYYSSFALTWLMYLVWFTSYYSIEQHFGLAITFLAIFFVTFYLIFLAYKLLRKEQFKIDDILLLLANSFIFYGIGYAIFDEHETGRQLLGLFTLSNAIVHFIVGAVIHKQKLADKNLFYLVLGLVLVFITISIPVQLNGNWVTLLWAGEAALLFWIGRTKKISIYEKLSYPIMLLAFISITQDWVSIYYGNSPELSEMRTQPLLNINFLSSVIFIAAFGFINYINGNKKHPSDWARKKGISNLISFFILAILIIVSYYAFRIEIANYWNQLYENSILSHSNQLDEYKYPSHYQNHDLKKFKVIWILNYTLLFVSAISFVNIKKTKDSLFGVINLGATTLIIVTFLIRGLYALSELRESYLEQILSQYYHRGVFNITIRYISFAFFSLALFACGKYTRTSFMKHHFKKTYDFLLYISILWIATSELINWMDIAKSEQSYKLGLSILWGSYSLLLIVLGIWKGKKHLRIGAISLFGVTLLKLFFYDIQHLNTIAKTIVFVSLGILLLIISFLYNKYKHIISNEVEN